MISFLSFCLSYYTYFLVRVYPLFSAADETVGLENKKISRRLFRILGQSRSSWPGSAAEAVGLEKKSSMGYFDFPMYTRRGGIVNLIVKISFRLSIFGIGT
tara:strand:- start:555 stop:857 length:303 start_codon:yes stop_codon:yes gene_type:complete